MIKVVNPQKDEWGTLLQRPTKTVDDIEATVSEIFTEVSHKGDTAVNKYTALFDGVQLNTINVSETEINTATNLLTDALKASIALAKTNIEKFHAAQKTERVIVETSPGVTCWQEKKPIEKIGLYIPGGSAPLFSTILMLAIPATLAGCKEIVLCTPPDKEGNINPAILYTAQLCGVSKIFKVGGIQAIAALTFGTETIPKVYKIFGPGNQFVTVAKQLATKHGVAIDMPAGPSELLVYADDSAIPEFIAADLLSQAEHGPDSQVVLVTISENIFEKVAEEVNVQLDQLPRKEIALKAIESSRLILIDSETTALEIINQYGPEHLIICSEHEDFFLSGVANAGSVFVGNYSPESAGDYASGTNHTLPTNGYAKQYSGVNLDSFTKSITYQKLTKEGITSIGSAVEQMAAAEGLQAHKNAITVRLKALLNE